VRDEIRRVEADRHIRDGVSAGHLKTLMRAEEQLLTKAAGALAPEEVEALRRALAHERVCAKTYLVTPKAAILWAVRRIDLFPRFPFGPADLSADGWAEAPEDAPRTQKERRAQFVDEALRHRNLSKAEFCRTAGLTVDILRAVVNADGRRADLAKWTPKVLRLLDIPIERWEEG
jgi:hypothetical protein